MFSLISNWALFVRFVASSFLGVGRGLALNLMAIVLVRLFHFTNEESSLKEECLIWLMRRLYVFITPY